MRMIRHTSRRGLIVRRLALGVMVFWAALALICTGSQVTAQAARGPIYTVEAEGIVTSVTIGYLRRTLRVAETANANVLVISLASEGGVLRDMRPFAREIADARIPVVVYVAPTGIQAGTTGTLLLSAAHVSAMAPDTSFGSPIPLAQVDSALSEQSRELVLASVTDQLRDWNAAHGRNTDWIARAVREGAVFTNEQAIALEPSAINLVAADLTQLLTLLEGRTVRLADGRSVTLSTLGRSTSPVEPSFWETFRMLLADPTVAFSLLVLGAMAIYLEFGAPGSTLFLGIGVVLLIGAILGLIVLPLNGWAMVLLLTGLVLIGLEFFVPLHGGLTVGGLVLLVIGGLNMIDLSQAPGAGVSPWAIAGVGLGLSAAAGGALWLALHSRAAPARTGSEALLGQVAEVRHRLDPEGMVFVEGALWRAVSENGTVEVGDWVRIAAVHNLRLIVQPIEDAGSADELERGV